MGLGFRVRRPLAQLSQDSSWLGAGKARLGSQV